MKSYVIIDDIFDKPTYITSEETGNFIKQTRDINEAKVFDTEQEAEVFIKERKLKNSSVKEIIKREKTTYRPRKKVVAELEAKNEITPFEAKQLNNAIEIADKIKYRGQLFLDLNLDKFDEAQKKELSEAIEKGKLTPNQKKTLHTLRVLKIEKPYLNNPISIQDAITKYLQLTLEDGNKPTVNGLALAIGISKKQMLDLINGNKVYINGAEVKGKEVIERALQVIATANEMDIAESGMGAMFLGKNFFGLNDKQELTINKKDDDVSQDDLDNKYKDVDIIDIDTPKTHKNTD